MVLDDLRIVLRLLDVELHTSTNNPSAAEHLREFVGAVKLRIPELAELPDHEVEERVLNAFDNVIADLCVETKKSYLVTRGGAMMYAYLFVCRDPEVGMFYIVKSESGNDITGEEHLILYATKSIDRAYGEYRSEAEAIGRELEKLRIRVEEEGRSLEDEVEDYSVDI